MMECSRCGASGDKVRLYDAVSKDGVVPICFNCSNREGIPVVKRPTTEQLKNAERTEGVYERLTRMSGVKRDYDEGKYSIKIHEPKQSGMIDKNYKIKREKDKNPRPELIDNFEWAILNARRARHMTHSQLAAAIGESEGVVRMVERRFLPEDEYIFLKKLEVFLNIKLIKDRSKVDPQPEPVIETPQEQPKKGFFSRMKDFFGGDDSGSVSVENNAELSNSEEKLQ